MNIEAKVRMEAAFHDSIRAAEEAIAANKRAIASTRRVLFWAKVWLGFNILAGGALIAATWLR